MQSPSHRFIVDSALRRHLESRAFPRPDFRCSQKSYLTRIAKMNYQLVKVGGWHGEDVWRSIEFSECHKANRTHFAPPPGGRPLAPPHATTSVCVARMDTASAAMMMAEIDLQAAVLNFANAFTPGGGYLRGARAQEEDLCRLMPSLYTSLKQLEYPLPPHGAHFTHAYLARKPNDYTLFDIEPLAVAVISAAMPDVSHSGCMGGKLVAGEPKWREEVNAAIRAVLHAASTERHDKLILGAFGCGAFGNPPDLVAAAMADALASDEFRGLFSHVVFAIVERRDADGGNVAAFEAALDALAAADAQRGGAPGEVGGESGDSGPTASGMRDGDGDVAMAPDSQL